MESSKKRKRDVDCPRITYDATTKVFDRLFKEESLEEMKNVVRKKLDLPSSLPVHLSQLRDGKSVVLEDDEDFDAFYASVHSTAVARIKVYLGDDQPGTADLDAGLADGSMQLLGPPTVLHAIADGHSSSKKRKVSFVEPTPQPQSLLNSEAPAEVPATINVISADAEQTHEVDDNTKKKKKSQNTKGKKKKGRTVELTSEDQSSGKQAQSDIAAAEASGSTSKKSTKSTTKGHVHVSEKSPSNAAESKKRPRTSTTDKSVESVSKVLDDAAAPRIDNAEDYPRSSKKSKHKHNFSENLNGDTYPTDDNQAESSAKSPEDSQHHTLSTGQADSSEVVLTRSPKLAKKSSKKKEVTVVDKESNGPLSVPSNSPIVVKRAKNQDPKPPASSSALKPNPKGETKNPGPSQSLKTPTKLTLNEHDRPCEQQMKASALVEGKTLTKKSKKNEVPVEALEANSTQEIDQAMHSDLMAITKAAVAAILARKHLPGEESGQTASRSLADATTPSPSIAPIISSSSLDNQPSPLNNISTIAGKPKTPPKCPVCDKTPYHFRSRCPIIKAGIRSMRQRIVELQRDTPEANDEEREKVIEELQRIIDKRTKRNRTPITTKNPKSIANKSLILPTLAADSSAVLEPPKASQAVKLAKIPSQETKNTPLPHLAEPLSFGDASSYTAQDLEALIRGPNVTLADVPSSDSSEDEEVLEEQSEEVQIEPSLSQGRIRYPSSSEEEEEEEEEEASPFVPSIIPLPIKSASELSSEDGSSRSENLKGDTSFHEVNDLGSSIEVDKTGDAAVNDAYAQDFAHLNAPEPPENGPKVVDDISSTLNGSQIKPKAVSDTTRLPVTIATPQPTPQSDPIEVSEQPASSSPQSPIVSIEEDTHPLQSTPKAEVAGRTKSQRISSILARKTATSKSHNAASRASVNGISNNFKSTKKVGSLTRITDLPIPINPGVRVIWPGGVQTRQQGARAEDGEEADVQGPPDASQAKQKNGQFGSKTSPNTTKTPVKIAKTPMKTPRKAPMRSNEEKIGTRSVAVPETVESPPSNAEQSLASWAVLEGNSLVESETPGMVDELRYSPDSSDFPSSAQKPATPAVVNGVSKEANPLFLHSSPAVVNGVSKEANPLFLQSESQQSFPYSQYPNFAQEPAGSEDEEDEVQASVVKPETIAKRSSKYQKFRSLTEIASQPTLFTSKRPNKNESTREEVMNLYGRTSKGEEGESEESDTESESDAGERKQTSHIPLGRRAGTLL